MKIGLIIVLIILIIFSALFSGVEIAYSSLSKSKIIHKFKNKKKTCKLILKHYDNFGQTLSTILISNNLVNIASSALVTYLFSTFIFHSGVTAALIATFVVTPIIVIFGEIIPKFLAKKYAYTYLGKMVYFIEFFNWLFFFITLPIKKIALSSKITNSESELKTFLNIANSEGVIEKREATLAKNALDLDSKVVNSIFVKNKNVNFVNFDDSFTDIKKQFQKSGFSRLPVKKNNKYIGIIILKDIIMKNKINTLENFLIKIPHISKNAILIKALEMMRRESTQIAFVTSSTKINSKIVGIITMENIIEQLVGEIYDEHDPIMDIKEIGLHKFIVFGTTSMAKLNKKFNFNFGDEKLNLKQWISKKINSNFKKGIVYYYKNKFRFKVISNKKHADTLIEIELK